MRDFSRVRRAVDATLDHLPVGRAEHERAHAEGVAACAVRLAVLRDEDPELAEITALLHDLGRLEAGCEGPAHGKAGAALAAPLLDEVEDLLPEDRTRMLRAVRRHARKKRIDDSFTELLKDADVWQLSRQGETWRPDSEKAVRLLLTERQLACGPGVASGMWPVPLAPARVATLLQKACDEFSSALAPLLCRTTDMPLPSRHAIHAIRQQARALQALLRHLSPLLRKSGNRRRMEALEAVLEAIGPVRDLDVLTRWLQKTVLADSHGNPDMSPQAVTLRRRLPERLARERTARVHASRRLIRPQAEALSLFAGEALFRELEAVSPEEFAACRSRLIRRLRRKLMADAAAMMDPSGLDLHAQHRFRIRSKEARTLLETLYERPNRSHPCFQALCGALEDLCRLLGARRDAMAGTRLLRLFLGEKHGGWDGGANLMALRRSYGKTLEARLEKRLPAACFTVRKLF